MDVWELLLVLNLIGNFLCMVKDISKTLLSKRALYSDVSIWFRIRVKNMG